jgi:ketosteroid isomerase-like protein
VSRQAATGPPESEFVRAFRAIFEEGNRAWNEGDIKRAYAALPEDIEYQLASTWPNARPLRGPDEVVGFFEDFREIFPDAQASLPELIEVDGRTIIVGFRVTGTGRSSGVGTEIEVWQLWDVREGMIPSRVREFPSRGEALAAAGISSREDE